MILVDTVTDFKLPYAEFEHGMASAARGSRRSTPDEQEAETGSWTPCAFATSPLVLTNSSKHAKSVGSFLAEHDAQSNAARSAIAASDLCTEHGRKPRPLIIASINWSMLLSHGRRGFSSYLPATTRR
jgi:hypothetical protein